VGILLGSMRKFQKKGRMTPGTRKIFYFNKFDQHLGNRTSCKDQCEISQKGLADTCKECKKRYRFKKATLYEREVIKSKNFLFAGRSFHTHTTGC
jgi:hypothetical protein